MFRLLLPLRFLHLALVFVKSHIVLRHKQGAPDIVQDLMLKLRTPNGFVIIRIVINRVFAMSEFVNERFFLRDFEMFVCGHFVNRNYARLSLKIVIVMTEFEFGAFFIA